MHTLRIQHQPDRGIAYPARPDRAQKGILDPHQGQGFAGGNSLAAMGIGRAAPDRDAIFGLRAAKAKLVSRKCQHPAQALLPQKARIVIEKPPGDRPDGPFCGIFTQQCELRGRRLMQLCAQPQWCR